MFEFTEHLYRKKIVILIEYEFSLQMNYSYNWRQNLFGNSVSSKKNSTKSKTSQHFEGEQQKTGYL